MRFLDLFCGIGGFRYALEQVAQDRGVRAECVLSCDIDPHCRAAYQDNFGEAPQGDIGRISAACVPDHDLLLAGFPCQPFSIIGRRQGFDDIRGTAFFEVARLLQEKQPQAFVLENVKMLTGHNQGRTLARILEVLGALGYQADWRVLNALDFGLPQKRERVFIAGFKSACAFHWPQGRLPMKPLREILEANVPSEFRVSPRIRARRRTQHSGPAPVPAIWHENKSGHVSVHPYSCALRAGASYNYLLVNGERRLTPREMLRLQGFPDRFKIVCSPSQTRRQAGNSLPVPVAAAVLARVLEACGVRA